MEVPVAIPSRLWYRRAEVAASWSRPAKRRRDGRWLFPSPCSAYSGHSPIPRVGSHNVTSILTPAAVGSCPRLSCFTREGIDVDRIRWDGHSHGRTASYGSGRGRQGLAVRAAGAAAPRDGRRDQSCGSRGPRGCGTGSRLHGRGRARAAPTLTARPPGPHRARRARPRPGRVSPARARARGEPRSCRHRSIGTTPADRDRPVPGGRACGWMPAAAYVSIRLTWPTKQPAPRSRMATATQMSPSLSPARSQVPAWTICGARSQDALSPS